MAIYVQMPDTSAGGKAIADLNNCMTKNNNIKVYLEDQVIFIDVTNVGLDTKIEDLTELFTKYGQVLDIQGSGDHYQLHMEVTEGRKAIIELNNVTVKESLIRVHESSKFLQGLSNKLNHIRMEATVDRKAIGELNNSTAKESPIRVHKSSSFFTDLLSQLNHNKPYTFFTMNDPFPMNDPEIIQFCELVESTYNVKLRPDQKNAIEQDFQSRINLGGMRWTTTDLLLDVNELDIAMKNKSDKAKAKAVFQNKFFSQFHKLQQLIKNNFK